MSFTNNFRNDLEFILNKVKNREYFSFSKYADGEYKILRNERITNCDGWTFDPKIHNKEYKYLLNSFQYNDPNYYVGISCKCCQPNDHVDWMRDNLYTNNVTWANIFVNSNYEYFKENFFSEFNSWNGDVTLVANIAGRQKKLPFDVDNYIPIHLTSWLNPDLENIINQLKIIASKQDNQLFLFSAGPLGNILSHQLHIENKNNTYIDIGSTINPWIVGNNRGYLNNIQRKTCIW